MDYKSVKGTKDILPPESDAWIFLEQLLRQVMTLYQYREIRTPVFEETAVFARGIGEETDIVGKEMYTFTDKGGTSLTLRPEMTAPVVRAYVQHHLGEQTALNKLYYIGAMFRQERPQAGRFRQFHQFGFESIGMTSPACDAEIIAMAAEIYDRLGIPYRLKLNSVGDETCRPAYRVALQSFLRGVFDALTPESQRRYETNPMRVLDSKAEQDTVATEGAPSILDYLSEDCATHFSEVKLLLDELGINYQVDSRLVRGLDYYTRTAFEFESGDLGSQDALGGGGRYDGLVEQLGGKATPAVGFAAGMERLLMVLEKKAFAFPTTAPEVYLIGLHAESRRQVYIEAMKLRRAGIAAELDFAGRSFKAQMRDANRSGAKSVVIIGEEEFNSGTAIIKNMGDGSQSTVSVDTLRTALFPES